MPPMKQPARVTDKDNPFDSYSLAQLARRLRVTRKRIRQMLQRGELPFVQICGQIRVPRRVIKKQPEND
jgi:excisionase family DNA binding protein